MAISAVLTTDTPEQGRVKWNASDVSLQADVDAKLAKAGGTMTGDIILAGAPSNNLHPATKAYADGIDAGAVHDTGDETVAGIKTFSSIPVLPATDPASANQGSRAGWVQGLATQVLFSNEQVATSADSNAAAAFTEWQQTNTTYVVKIRCAWVKKAGQKYIRLMGAAKASAAAGWGIRITAGGAQTVVTGTNTSYGGTPEVNGTVDISALTAGTRYEVTVELRGLDATTVGNLKEAVLLVEPGF